MNSEVDIAEPSVDESIHTALDISQGAPITKLDRLEILDEDTWEDITLEIVFYRWKKDFPKVVRCGGGGDMGRDVIAYVPNGEWNNFQCKYYANALKLDEAITEIGKLIYYCYKGEYSVPSKYLFVAPKGVTTQLLNHLMNSQKLKESVFERWEKRCKNKITKKEKVVLSKELISFIDSSIDFEIFEHIPPLEIIQLHSETPYHAIRFGGSPKKRTKPPTPPLTLADKELIYTSELFLAFSDVEGTEVNGDNVFQFVNYESEYNSARKNFYSAEGLEKFSRDWLPDGSYDELLDECYETVSPVALRNHDNGFERYLSVSEQAATADYHSHPLHHYIKVFDKKGLCHHLVNNKKLKWIKK
ncbi:ABC-three component system protein [Aliikangiella sp. IMCC44359]|uniref:ABC-three component system protein n=1 Tax=Aliikangiella sp. IMCC44359 TaxID=3459125 RepID=UPI00403B3099